MPTGYTAAISDGITFREFALQCARAFGATISMRDDPLSADLPDKFAPSPYNRDRLKEEKEKLERIESMSMSELEAEAEKEYTDTVAQYTKYIKKAKVLQEKYKCMLAQVKRWRPPTADHENLKDFMQKQILESIQFDCDTKCWEKAIPKCQKTGKEWQTVKVAELLRSIGYNAAEWEKEKTRTASRSAWVKALRESLD